MGMYNFIIYCAVSRERLVSLVQKTTKGIESYVNEMARWTVDLYCKACSHWESSVERTIQSDLPKTITTLFLFVGHSVLAALSLPYAVFRIAQL
jgi:hypothetical protein